MGKRRIPSRKKKWKQRKSNNVKLFKNRKGRRSRNRTAPKAHVQQTAKTNMGVSLASWVVALVMIIFVINFISDGSDKKIQALQILMYTSRLLPQQKSL